MDALLLSEGVCHQLGIISYHPSVCPPLPLCAETVGPPDQDTKVPAVHVPLVQSVHLPPLTATIATVRLQDTEDVVDSGGVVQEGTVNGGGQYKQQYDKRATYTTSPLKTGDWVLVRFPQVKTGAARKLSRHWHGPYQITSLTAPTVSVTKVYFPQDQSICVHESQVKQCPDKFPGGFYWYGGKRRRRGRPPRWVCAVLDSVDPTVTASSPTSVTDHDDQS